MNEQQIRINNLLSSIIWTASKLQEQHCYETPLDASSIQILEFVDRELDIVLDYEERHI